MRRQLGLPGAVVVGLGSMLGAGVFVSLAFAVQFAGDAVVLSLLLAAGVAACNGLSSAQLAACHPVSGGTYEYGYRWLHPTLGFAAGWLFLLAKSASAAAAALGLGAYVGAALGWPPGWARVLVAAFAVLLLTILVLRGIDRTVQVNAVMVLFTLLGLFLYIAAGLFVGFFGPEELQPPMDAIPVTGRGVLRGAALLFVAFTGYGRIATLGEEIRDPRHAIPRAVIVTVAFVGVLYAAVATSSLLAVGSIAFADSFDDEVASLVTIAFARFGGGIAAAVTLSAMTALSGVLLGLILGLSRVLLAMARRGDMPALFRGLNAQRTAAPAATLAVGAVVLLLVLVGSVRVAWSFSALTVLLYYGIANLAALRVDDVDRFVPRAVSWTGLAGCLLLVGWLDLGSWRLAAVAFGIGVLWFCGAAALRRRRVRP